MGKSIREGQEAVEGLQTTALSTFAIKNLDDAHSAKKASQRGFSDCLRKVGDVDCVWALVFHRM